MKRVGLFVLLMCAVMSLQSSPASAQTCSVQVTNAVGDTIGVTATLVTSDPNENGEGEPLVVSSSGGEINAVIGAYSVPTPFTFTARVPNETISGFIIGFDGDEGCSIGATVNGAHTFSPQTKSTANVVATVGGVAAVLLGAVAAGLGCTFTAGALCVGLIVATAGGGLSWAIGGGVAGDPSDPNFKVIATPIVATIPSIVTSNDTGGVTQAEADAFNALFANEAAVVGIGKAALTSANRAQGAHDAGDAFWEGKQTAAVQLYAAQLGALFGGQVDLLKSLRDALAAAGFSATASPFSILSFEQQLAFGGLPDSFLQALHEFGADADLIEQVRQLLMVQDIFASAGTIPDGLIPPQLEKAIKDFAGALSGVKIQIKPGSTAPVPVNPRADGVIPVAILSADDFDATTVDPATVKFGPNGAANSHQPSFEDVDGDGTLDIVLHFRAADTGIACGDTLGGLTGATTAKQSIAGVEPIRTVGCH